MASIDWEELGLEEECYSCKGRGHRYERHGCGCCVTNDPKDICKSCEGKGTDLTMRGYEFLEFIARHWDKFQEILKEEQEEQEKKKQKLAEAEE